ncbi:MAG TPA: type II toxin-antitoxin system VapB family antitoxin [Thermoanaerobaculia bacterium]|nr:type II toxin-antitoxin system VapB family antitoxin [Acidobacteriota bacterium]HNZ96156.1 type II toxin-antitoxin system VapB family antitoxin [Thermoanaerobaculia bacterium]HPA96236.1 type II toxin-antitoxin system VapB family antitoxin [Thermoanaerobaculia bacterium]HRR14574.1 type II toxin-antitoxin system VapB family antitoxin [Thermoanaerobaculia bacterium]HRU09446.1 type II toxin-antitoxin system VapB family antitoxin [Thermoanaerobaculia bacterium]
MALNIKNSVVEELAEEVARLAGETKTEAIRRALAERRQRLALELPQRDRRAELTGFLEREVWATIRARAMTRLQSR